MAKKALPEWYEFTRKKYKKVITSLEKLGEAVRQEGPLDEKTSQLIQLGAAAAIRSEGSVHSHVRRAIAAGAEPDEVYHAIILLTSTIGFPSTSAALSWAFDVINGNQKS